MFYSRRKWILPAWPTDKSSLTNVYYLFFFYPISPHISSSSSSPSFVYNVSLCTFRYVRIHLDVQADEWWFIVFSFNFFLYMLHLYMRSSERHSLATTMTTRPKYSSRFNSSHIYIFIFHMHICVHRSPSFFPVSLSLLFSLAHFSLQSIYVYISTTRSIDISSFLVGGGDNLVFCIIIIIIFDPKLAIQMFVDTL